MHFQSLDAYSRQCFCFCFFVLHFPQNLFSEALHFVGLLVRYCLMPILALLRKVEDLPHVLHMAFIFISSGIWTFFSRFMLLILCIYFSSPSSSHFELVFLIILIDTALSCFFNYSLLLQHFSHLCSTVPSPAPLLPPPFFLCEKMQLEYLPVNCNHFSGSDGSRDCMYCAWTRGKGKSLKKTQILSAFFSEDRSRELGKCIIWLFSHKRRVEGLD